MPDPRRLAVLVTLAAVAAILADVVAAPPVAAQTLRLSEDTFSLPELGAVVVAEAGSLRVVFAEPPADAPVRLADGDLVLMIDGRKLEGLAALREAYAAAAVGAEVKLAVERDGRPFLARFTKADPLDVGAGPQVHRMEMRFDFDPATFDELAAAPELGAMLGTKDGELRVAGLLPGLGDDAGVAQGDVLVDVDGEAVTTPQAAVDRLAALAVGASFRVTVLRDGERRELALVKPERQVRLLTRN